MNIMLLVLAQDYIIGSCRGATMLHLDNAVAFISILAYKENQMMEAEEKLTKMINSSTALLYHVTNFEFTVVDSREFLTFHNNFKNFILTSNLQNMSVKSVRTT